MVNEVIAFKAKDTSAKDIEAIKTFLRNINAVESYNFFYLDASKDSINTTLEITKWETAITRMREAVLKSVTVADRKVPSQFVDMVNGIDTMPIGGLIGVGFDARIGNNISTHWSFMLCKTRDDNYLIRDLIRNGTRVLIRG